MSIRNKIHCVDLKIDKLSKKGNGIGFFKRADETFCPVEVPFSIPGDQVHARLLRRRQGMYQSVSEGILEPSPDRIAPRCKHFGVCGGCRWQQLSYQWQLDYKQKQVRDYFSSLMTQEVEVCDILACKEEWHYRNKMEFSFSSDKAGNHYSGLFMDAGRGKVFDLTECHLTHPWFVAALDAAKEWWKESGLDAYHAMKNTGSLRTLTLREGKRTGDRMVNLTVSGNPDYALKKHHLESFVSLIRNAVEPRESAGMLSIFLTIQQTMKGQRTRFYEMHLYGADHIREVLNINLDPSTPPVPLTFKISSSAFFQPNTSQAEQLYNAMLRMAVISKSTTVYDLYCGTGTLGICAGKRAKQVVGIEISPEAVLDARHNAKENGVHNVTFLQGSVHEKLDEIRREKLFPLPDLILVDPPRAGLEKEAISHLLGLAPPKIVYISCNPATQAENVKELVAGGYRLTALQPVDQFPHTIHIENIAILSKL